MKKKVKQSCSCKLIGTTLPELLVSMLLTTIILAVIGQLFSSFNRERLKDHQTIDQSSGLFNAIGILNHDFSACDSFDQSDGTLRFYPPEVAISYFPAANNLIRSIPDRSDTFEADLSFTIKRTSSSSILEVRTSNNRTLQFEKLTPGLKAVSLDSY